MASPWKGILKYTVPSAGYDVGPTVSDPAWVPDCESVSLERGEEIRERTNRISGYRVPDVDLQTVEQEFPTGDFVIHPRPDDVLPLLMGFFQAVDLEGTLQNGVTGTFVGPGVSGDGRFTFAPIEDQPDFEGSSWGVMSGTDVDASITTGDVYPLTVYVWYGDEFSGNNTLIYRRCLVGRLSFSQPFNEDLGLTVSLLPRGTVLNSEISVSSITSGTMVSTKDRFVDWTGTLLIDGSEVEVESIELNFDNTLEGKGRLGDKGYVRYNFGRGEFGGSFEHELDEDIRNFMAGTSAELKMSWYSSTGTMEIYMPNIKYEPNTPGLSGDSRTMRSVPFRAWASEGTHAVIVTVWTKLTEGTAGFDRSVNTTWPTD